MATLVDFINLLLDKQDLTFEQARELMDLVFSGEVPEPQVAAFLTALRAKGEKTAEVAGLASSLRSHAVKVETSQSDLVDVVGTGGAAIKTFNVSTASAIVTAGAGVSVAKHGNRGITSKCGAGDVLEALGVKIDVGPEVVARCIEQAGIGFMFAPMFHPAMKYVQPVRKALGFRTVFNILGPLANPAGAPMQLLGVADASLINMMVEALGMLGVKRAMVVHSEGLDELSTFAKSLVAELKDGQVTKYELDAQDLGIPVAQVEQLQIKDAQESADVIRKIVSGQLDGPKRDIILLNTSAALVVAGKATDFKEAYGLALESITSGKAKEALDALIEVSNS